LSIIQKHVRVRHSALPVSFSPSRRFSATGSGRMDFRQICPTVIAAVDRLEAVSYREAGKTRWRT
jgi:hypothetical protein